MEDPAPEPAVTEVTTGSKIQPSKGGNYMDLDEETTEKTEKTEGPVSVVICLHIFSISLYCSFKRYRQKELIASHQTSAYHRVLVNCFCVFLVTLPDIGQQVGNYSFRKIFSGILASSSKLSSQTK